MDAELRALERLAQEDPSQGPRFVAALERAGYKRLLDRVAEGKRSLIANRLLEAIRRDGATTPEEVVSTALATARKWPKPSENDSLIVEVLCKHAEEARDLARFYLAWRAVPSEARDALKTAHGREHAARAMSNKPATEKQIDYLRSLGVTEVPADRSAASKLIDAALASRKTVRP